MGLVKNEDIFTANKTWGTEFLLKLTPLYTVKMVEIKAGKSTKKKSYTEKEETWVVTIGDGSVNINNEKIKIKSGDIVHISPEVVHFASAGQFGLTMVVISSPELWED